MTVVLAATIAHGEDGVACRLEPFAHASVSAVLDGRTLRLDDGREVRLAGIEIPDAAATHGQTAENARSALARLVFGKEVTLKGRQGAADRYGRLLAHVFVGEGESERWVQEELAGSGQALLSARLDDRACAAALRARERAARQARLGLWADPYYVIHRAEHPTSVLAERGHFALVEGKVLSVRESGGTIYVNFGRRWSQDFTVTIAKRNERIFADAGLAPKTFAGHRVRVRGYVEERGGPWVEATRPEQIELVEGK